MPTLVAIITIEYGKHIDVRLFAQFVNLGSKGCLHHERPVASESSVRELQLVIVVLEGYARVSRDNKLPTVILRVKEALE